MSEWRGIWNILRRFSKVKYQVLLYITTTAIIVALSTILYNMSYNILNHAVKINGEVYGKFTDIYYDMDETHPFFVSEQNITEELEGFQYERMEQLVIVKRIPLKADQMICLGYADNSAIELSGIRLQEGHYPNQENEIALTKTISKQLGAETVGASVTIDGEIYKVAGIIKDYGRLWAKGEQQITDQAIPINGFLSKKKAEQLIQVNGVDYHMCIFTRLSDAKQSYDSSNRYFFFNKNASVGKMVVFEIPEMFGWMMYGFAVIMSYAIIGLYEKKEKEQIKILYMLGMKKNKIRIYLILKYISYSIIGILIGLLIGIIGSKILLNILSSKTNIQYPNEMDWRSISLFGLVVFFINIVISAVFIWNIMREKTVILKEYNNPAYKKTGWKRIIFWEYLQNKKMFFVLMIVVAASIVLFLYSIQYQVYFKNSSGYVEYDGKMPYDYDYGWETIMRQGEDRKNLDADSVAGMQENGFTYIDSLELDGMKESFVEQMSKEEGIQKVLAYKQDSRCSVALEIDQLDSYLDGFDYMMDGDFYSVNDVPENAKEYFQYSDNKRYVPSCFMGYSEDELESFSKYVTEGEIHLDKILSGEEIILMVPNYQLVDVDGTNYMFPVNSGEEESYKDTLFQVGDELHLTELQTLQQYTGTVMEDECEQFLKRRDFTVKIGAIIRSHIGWFDYSLGPRKAYTFLTLNDTFERYGLGDVTYSRVRIYTEPLADFNEIREKMAMYQEELPTMKLTNLQEELSAYRQYNLCLENFVYVIFIICTLITFITFCSQMIEKTILYQKKYALLRICGMKRSRLEICIGIQTLGIWGCGVIMSLPILYGIIGKEFISLFETWYFWAILGGSVGIVFTALLPCLALIRKSKIIM
ncbi:MAG: ABC transporter permease [Clostridiales bacterium]|nr:ABC transporter permease [Clostridiales bacterium]